MADGVRTDGRKAERTATFATALRELRASAGTPSFRRMAQLSGCVSHTTLHESATGSRFPSWETTREFVLACGGDPESWRERWQQAGSTSDRDAPTAPGLAPAAPTGLASAPPTGPEPVAATRPAPVAEPEPVAGPAAVSAATSLAANEVAPVGATEPTPPAEPVDAVRTKAPLWRRRWMLTSAAAVVVVLTAVGLAVGLHRPSPVRPASLDQTSVGTVPSDAGDASAFVADVTIPDGTVVGEGQPFQKVWELQNTGSVTWHDRYLQRMDEPSAPGSCRTPARVPIGDTLPGQNAWISVNVVARNTPGTCWVGWKMSDASGRLLLPGYRPVYFLVTVKA